MIQSELQLVLNTWTHLRQEIREVSASTKTETQYQHDLQLSEAA